MKACSRHSDRMGYDVEYEFDLHVDDKDLKHILHLASTELGGWSMCARDDMTASVCIIS